MIDASRRMQQLDTQFFSRWATKIEKIQSEGKKVIRMDVGSPDLPPAPFIIEVLARSATLPNHHGYQSHHGTRSLREGWAMLYRREFGVELDPDHEIIPLLGSKEGIFHLINAYIEPGDVVLIPDPGYLTYEMATRFAGGEAYRLPLLPENRYLPDLKAIPSDILKRARLLWINYPNNPTAAIAPEWFLEEAIAFAHHHNIFLCHDAAYSLVTFDGYKAPSILQFARAKEIALEFNSLSKSHNMAGWRIGVALGNPQALNVLFTMKTQADSSHFLPILEAAAIAMTGDQTWLEMRNDIYRQRRDLVLEWLSRIGLNPETPKASLYIWCPLPPGWTSNQFAERLLEEAAISVTPGTVFGKFGEGFFRIALTVPQEELEEAMEIFYEWLSR